MFNFKETLHSSMTSAWLVLKLIIPLYILADLLLYYDVLQYIAFLFEPITDLLDLPKEAALGIAAGMLFNIYAGISYTYSFTLRIVMAFVAVIPILYMPKEFFEGSVVVSDSIQKVVYSDVSELLKNSFFNATMLSLKVIVLITVIIFLMAYLKSTKMMQKYQEKVNTSFSIMAGLILGITYGAGILIHEVKSGSLSKVDIFYIATFYDLSLCDRRCFALCDIWSKRMGCYHDTTHNGFCFFLYLAKDLCYDNRYKERRKREC